MTKDSRREGPGMARRFRGRTCRDVVAPLAGAAALAFSTRALFPASKSPLVATTDALVAG